MLYNSKQLRALQKLVHKYVDRIELCFFDNKYHENN